MAMGWTHLGNVGVKPPERGEADPAGLWCLSGGNDWWRHPDGGHVCGRCESIPDPLTNDADAMALVRKLDVHIGRHPRERHLWTAFINGWFEVTSENINLAIVECVAKKQFART